MFDTHKLNEQGFAQVKIFKDGLANAVNALLVGIPDGREKALFMTNMETAVFYGTKAIASKPGNYTEIVQYPVKG